MPTDKQGFANIIVIGAIVLLIGAAGYFVLTQKSVEPPATPVDIKLGEIPRSAEIVYHDNVGYIFVMDRNGGNSMQITFDPITDLEHVAVSPDRRYIAANERRADPAGGPASLLWVFDLGKRTKTLLVPDLFYAGDGGIDWDTKGFIYFAATRAKSEVNDVYKVKFDGTDIEKLTSSANAHDVSVSKDGKLVAFAKMVMNPAKNGGHTEIWSMATDGKNLKLVYRAGAIGIASAHDPEHSPDNKEMVFSMVNSNVPGNFPSDTGGANTAHDLWRINLDGSGLTRLTRPGPISAIPDWMGNTIIYTELNGKDKYEGASTVNADGIDQLPTHIKAGALMMKWIPSNK